MRAGASHADAVHELLAARSRHDRERIAGVVTRDVEWVFPRSADRPPLRGAHAVEALAGEAAGRFFELGTLSYSATRVTCARGVAAVEQTLTGTLRDGRRYEADYVWIYEFRGGLIARMFEHADTLRAAELFDPLR